MRNKEFEQATELRKEAKRSQGISQLNNYLDEKDYLTGSPYDPALVKKIHDAKQEGYKLFEQGLSATDVFMTLGKKVSEISEYSQKAKQINRNIKLASEARKALGGYNVPQIEEGTRKSVFLNEDGTEKDIRDIDPNKDYVSEYIDKNPYESTTDKGFDEFFRTILPQESIGKTRTSVGGKSVEQNYAGKMYPWQRMKHDEKGHTIMDEYGNVPLEIDGDIHTDADGKPYNVIKKDYAKTIFDRNYDLKDRVRGYTKKDFQELEKSSNGKFKIPEEGSDEWDLQERKVLSDILQQRGGGRISIQRKTDDGVRLYKPTEKKAEKTKGVFD
jgi:hypothetical protein